MGVATSTFLTSLGVAFDPTSSADSLANGLHVFGCKTCKPSLSHEVASAHRLNTEAIGPNGA
jgi:hypothetical protein